MKFTKSQSILSAILLVLVVVNQQCEATALGEVNDPDHIVDSTAFRSPIGHASIRGIVDDIRRLEEKKENVHKRGTKPMFRALLASVIVNIVSLITLLSLIPVLMSSKRSCFKSAFWLANTNLHIQPPTEIAGQLMNIEKSTKNQKVDKHAKELETATLLADIFIPSVACGAILGTALFLIIPEAILFIQRGTSSEEGEIEILTGTISRFGAALMTGYMLPLVLGALFPRSSEHVWSDECVSSGDLTDMVVRKNHPGQKIVKIVEEEEKVEDGAGETSLQLGENFDDESPPMQGELKQGDTFESKTTNTISDVGSTGDSNEDYDIDFGLATKVLIGDAIHNFFDGIFIGVAFLTCSNAAAVCVTLIAIYNEVSQEMADYFLLTKCAGISIPRALLLNFASGLAVVLGALSIISAELNELAIGVFLAFSAGVYLHISASQCLPRVYSVVKVSRDRYFSVLFFIAGALPIGLSLLKHGHCE